mmetsp:Transcript_28/g.54  ORF Transcript_28/g.54 Transcript_28/m.54 type:complete len:219 (+) Transcript_28:644-1300(+)
MPDSPAAGKENLISVSNSLIVWTLLFRTLGGAATCLVISSSSSSSKSGIMGVSSMTSSALRGLGNSSAAVIEEVVSKVSMPFRLPGRGGARPPFDTEVGPPMPSTPFMPAPSPSSILPQPDFAAFGPGFSTISGASSSTSSSSECRGCLLLPAGLSLVLNAPSKSDDSFCSLNSDISESRYLLLISVANKARCCLRKFFKLQNVMICCAIFCLPLLYV